MNILLATGKSSRSNLRFIKEKTVKWMRPTQSMKTVRKRNWKIKSGFKMLMWFSSSIFSSLT